MTQMCYVCHNVFKIYKTTESVAPWLCICQKTYNIRKSVQRLITHQCDCPVRTLKTSGRKLVYCDCA